MSEHIDCPPGTVIQTAPGGLLVRRDDYDNGCKWMRLDGGQVDYYEADHTVLFRPERTWKAGDPQPEGVKTVHGGLDGDTEQWTYRPDWDMWEGDESGIFRSWDSLLSVFAMVTEVRES